MYVLNNNNNNNNVDMSYDELGHFSATGKKCRVTTGHDQTAVVIACHFLTF